MHRAGLPDSGQSRRCGHCHPARGGRSGGGSSGGRCRARRHNHLVRGAGGGGDRTGAVAAGVHVYGRGGGGGQATVGQYELKTGPLRERDARRRHGGARAAADVGSRRVLAEAGAPLGAPRAGGRALQPANEEATDGGGPRRECRGLAGWGLLPPTSRAAPPSSGGDCSSGHIGRRWRPIWSPLARGGGRVGQRVPQSPGRGTIIGGLAPSLPIPPPPPPFPPPPPTHTQLALPARCREGGQTRCLPPASPLPPTAWCLLAGRSFSTLAKRWSLLQTVNGRSPTLPVPAALPPP